MGVPRYLLATLGVAVAAMAGVAELPSLQARGEERGLRLAEELALSAEQVEAARKLWTDEARRTIQRRAELALARLDLRELMDAPQPDEKAIAVKLKQMTAIRGEALQAQVARGLALRKLLSDEQRDKLKTLWPGRRDGAGRGPGPGRGRPRPLAEAEPAEEDDDEAALTGL